MLFFIIYQSFFKKICKFLIFIIITQVLIVCLSGCNLELKNVKKQSQLTKENGDIVYTKDFGSYTVNDGWEESKTHSSNGKYFYVKKGEDKEKRPNNISINEGKNNYKKEEHMQFKDAIYAQLARQVSKDAVIKASGSNTEKGEILYTFIINDKDIIAKQYYIVGDNKYIFICETVFNKDDEDKVDEVALKMVNSFEWNN